ncbi:MAG: hypothetical protein ACXWF6_09910, partial [Usitatibacter sp.]
HWIFEDYRKANLRLDELAAHAQRIEAAYLASQQQLAATARERDMLATRLAQLEPKSPETGWRRK